MAVSSKRSSAGKRQELIWMSQYDWARVAREIKKPVMKSFAHFFLFHSKGAHQSL